MQLNQETQHRHGKYLAPRSLVLRLLLSGVTISAVLTGIFTGGDRAIAVPQDNATHEAPRAEWQTSEEIPEEILRTEIITGASSPLTGEVVSAAEYAQLQAELAGPAGDTLVSEDLEYLIFLLQFRRAIRPIIPFL